MILCLQGYSGGSTLLEPCIGMRDLSKSLDGRGTVGGNISCAGVCCPESNTLEICWSRISCTFSSNGPVRNTGSKTVFVFALWYEVERVEASGGTGRNDVSSGLECSEPLNNF